MEEEEAHGEANMLRAHLAVDPETGRMAGPLATEVEGRSEEDEFDFVEREPTAEDYDKALQALAELRKDQGFESSAQMRGLIRATQMIKMFGLGGLYAGRAIEAAMGAIMPKEERTSFKEGWAEGKETTDNYLKNVFDDAESRLERLKAATAKFERKERKG